MKHIVMGILAHVDSGKTTLSEALLYASGSIKRLGRVDKGDAFLDNFALERSRGITIFAKQAVMPLENATFTLLDTPGHVDFSAEAERTLSVLDCALLVISGTDGVQSHTETLWQLLKRYNVPTFIFVNKTDLAGVSKSDVLAQLEARFGNGFMRFDGSKDDAFYEKVAMCGDNLLEEYLANGKISDDLIADAISKRALFPCLFGSALKLAGIETLLNTLILYAKEPVRQENFGAKIFKISRDNRGERLAHMKITGGSLKTKAMLTGEKANGEAWAEKANQLRIYSGEKFTAVDEAVAGEICAVTGLSFVHAGDGLGCEKHAAAPSLTPVLTYKLLLPPDADAHVMLSMLRRIEEEEPALNVVWNERAEEIHVQLMGEIQLEILQSLIAERYGVQVQFGQGSIVYKETIEKTVEGVGHFEPLRVSAAVHLVLDIAPRVIGIILKATCRSDDLDTNWQRLILTHLAEKNHLGVLTGSPLTDVQITLAAGRAHLKHTEGGDFRQATYRAVRNGLMCAKSVLLEPWYSFVLTLPSSNVGRAIADLQRMGGTLLPPENDGEVAVLKGSMPVETMRGYHTVVAGYTKGIGRLICTLDGYKPCHNAQEIIEKAAYDPEADIENTPDSVFCSHGSGFNVKWTDVANYMHLESVLKPKKEQDKPALMRRAAEYCAGLEQDKELLAIFERTYGTIKNRAFDVMRTPVKERTEVKAPQEYSEYLLVDGYNIIFAWDEVNAIAKDNLDLARRQLITMMCNYQGFKQCELILVFDAYKVTGGAGAVEKLHNITVVYTKEAETADMYIEKTVHTLAKNRRVRVATSDGTEQLIILGQGALRLSANAFHDEVKAVEKAIKEYLTTN